MRIKSKSVIPLIAEMRIHEPDAGFRRRDGLSNVSLTIIHGKAADVLAIAS
jgi:hypothetical protein